jgi:hypothetical protein
MSGLQAPVVVNPAHPNLDGVQVALSCQAWPPLGPQDATRLCGRVQRLLEVQGATVRDGQAPADPGALDPPAPAAAADPLALPRLSPAPAPPAPTGPDLRLSLTARVVHRARYPLSWLACAATATLVPAWSEATFAQRVEIRDARGALLVDRELQGRTVRRFGAGALLGALVDRVARDPSRQVSGPAADRALSADLYGQLSQALYNAHVQDRARRSAARGPG